MSQHPFDVEATGVFQPQGGFTKPADAPPPVIVPVDTREPAVRSGTAVVVVASSLAVAVSFGLPITQEQHEAILVFVATVGPMLAALWTRRRVSPVKP